MARVLVVEDRSALRRLIVSELEPDFEIVGQVASLAEARAVLADAEVMVLDLGLPDGCGADLISELRDTNPKARTIVFSATCDPALQARALDCGAAAVLDKTRHLGQLGHAVRRVLAGESLLLGEDLFGKLLPLERVGLARSKVESSSTGHWRHHSDRGRRPDATTPHPGPDGRS